MVRTVDEQNAWPKALQFIQEFGQSAGQLSRRPIRLLVPLSLDRALKKAARELKCTKIAVLMSAAKAYRNQYPIPSDWEDPAPPGYGKVEKPRKRKSLTLRLEAEDRDLLQNIGRGRSDVADRHTALELLAQLITETPEKIKIPQRPKTVLLKIPDDVMQEIDAIHAKKPNDDKPRPALRDILMFGVKGALKSSAGTGSP